MIVVGVGCGPGMMTCEAIRVVADARTIFGSRRSIELARLYVSEKCKVEVIEDYSRLDLLPKESVVLSTGDPMLAGLGHLGDEVIPGVSSMQLAFARLRLPLDRATVISVHGKGKGNAIADVAGEIGRNRTVFLLADPTFDMATFAAGLGERGLDCKIIVCENLGYENESIGFGDVKRPPTISSDLFSVIVTCEQR